MPPGRTATLGSGRPFSWTAVGRGAPSSGGKGTRMERSRRSRRAAWLLPLCAAVTLGAGIALAAGTPAAVAATGSGVPGTPSGLVGWTQVGSYDENTLSAGEGVATVSTTGGTEALYRGIQSVPSAQQAQGWNHIGDPDSVRGDVFDAYQGPSTGNSKMFLVTNPAGQIFEYIHTLVRGELYNNSFDAISPDTQWMVAGEWETMSHLQVYPTPLLNRRTPRQGGPLPLAGYIRLDHKVNDIQGCDFVTPAKLLCVSDDDSKRLFPNEKPLLEIDLPRPLHGTTVAGHVVDLGPIPQESSCSGTFEAEGIDFDATTRTLRVEIIQPASCILMTTIYEYKPASRH